MNTLFIGVAAYIFAQFAIGLLASRRSGNETDYLLAGRSIGPLLGTFTVFATWFGAESVIGAAGLIYSDGFSGATGDPFGYAFCLILLGIVFAVPLWRRQYTTFGDFFRERYSAGVEKLFILLVVPSAVLWAAAQVRAFGHVVGAISDIDTNIAITIAAGLILVYTVAGGMRATAVTDLIQGLGLILGLTVLAIAVFASHGIGELIDAVPADRFTIINTEQYSWLEIIEQWALPICGATLAAEVIARVLAMRSAETARKASIFGGLFYLMFGFIPVFLGLVGAELIPGLEDPEQIIPALADEYLTGFLTILFIGALVSAILSTVDSALLAAASLVSHNVVVPLTKTISDRGKVVTARMSVIALGLVAWYFAIHAGGVYELIETAVAFGTAGVFVVGSIGLFSRFGNHYSAYAALLSGAFTWLYAANYTSSTIPYLSALASALLAYCVLAFIPAFNRQKPRADKFL